MSRTYRFGDREDGGIEGSRMEEYSVILGEGCWPGELLYSVRGEKVGTCKQQTMSLYLWSEGVSGEIWTQEE